MTVPPDLGEPGVLVVDAAGYVHRFAFGAGGGAPLHAIDTNTLDRAVAGAVPWVADVRRIDDPWPRALRHVGSPPGAYAPGSVTDRSFELSAAVWRAARWMGVRLPESVWASATVAADGTLGRVGDLDRKAAEVPDGHTLVVWKGQAHEARRAGLTVLAATTLAEAVNALWPTPVFPALGRDAADAAWTFALRRGGAGPWRAVAKGLELLAGQYPRESLAVAASIARRHTGKSEGLDVSPELLSTLPLALRLECGAHVLQGYADGGAEGWEPVAERWAAAVPPGGDVFPPHLKLMGALGRLYAAWRRYDEAVVWLDRAVDGWFDLHEPKDASYPLCERLRVESIRLARDGGDIRHDLLARALESLRHQPDPRWIVLALCRLAWAASDTNRLHQLARSFPDVVTQSRWGLAPVDRADPVEAALAALLRDPGDTVALDVLRADTRTELDTKRFDRLRAPDEPLGEVIAREWRY